MTVIYVDRADWGAGALGSGHIVSHSQFTGLAAHHTVMVMPDYDRDGYLHGDLDDVRRYMRQLQHSRPDLGDEVPYSFVVFEGARPGDCIVAEGRGWGVTGAHTSGQNSSRYGVALAGNSTARRVTDGMVEGYRWVGRQLANPRRARPTIGHRDVKATECPGDSLYARLDEIQPPFTAATTAPPTPVQEDDDMLLIAAPNRPATLLTGKGFAKLKEGATVSALKSAGVKEIKISTVEYDNLDHAQAL